MAYRVRLSKQAKAVLERLAAGDKGRCRYLALLLLRLKKDPLQPGSRDLNPIGSPIPGSRVWKPERFEILYQIDEDEGEVVVAKVKLDGVDPTAT